VTQSTHVSSLPSAMGPCAKTRVSGATRHASLAPVRSRSLLGMRYIEGCAIMQPHCRSLPSELCTHPSLTAPTRPRQEESHALLEGDLLTYLLTYYTPCEPRDARGRLGKQPPPARSSPARSGASSRASVRYLPEASGTYLSEASGYLPELSAPIRRPLPNWERNAPYFFLAIIGSSCGE